MNVIRAGEVVFSRDQWDEAGAVEAKVVEEVFARFAGVLHLHLPNGAVIRTTHEHPFFVAGQGWTPANQLQPGDRLVCADRTTVAVEEVFDTGEWEAVYNLRVADHHTYFVREVGWGWEVWAHNLYTAIGRMEDLARFDDDKDVDTWRKSGRKPGPGEPPVTWKENEQWLFERYQRGDNFAIATDPATLPPVVGGFVPGQPNGYFTARELEFLTKELSLVLGKDIALWYKPGEYKNSGGKK